MSSAPFFFARPEIILEGSLTLDPQDAYHLRVRRCRAGDRITVGDGFGRLFEARIENLAQEVTARIESVSHVPAPVPHLSVFQGLAKGAKIDWLIEKLVELGVDRVAIFAASRSVPTWDGPKAQTQNERWRRVALAAAKQSRRAWLPKIEGPLTLDQVADLTPGFDAAFVADPGAQRSLREELPATSPDTVAVVIGPEGGLGPAEELRLVDAGAHAVNLGPQILRAETAGLAVASAIMFHYGRFG
ncbi:MAG: RsmE family RNA methyltransferase [Actinomycetota bacterium]